LAEARILLSARDPGAVGNLLPLLALLRESGYTVNLASSGAALERLRGEGESPNAIRLPDGRDHIIEGEDPSPLLAEAQAVLRSERPDLVIVSLSSLGAGIDEALCRASRVPVLAYQDFWGDVNPGLGRTADLYLTMDEAATRLTRKRWAVECATVGSLKYHCYSESGHSRRRGELRAALGLEGRAAVGYFGQPPEVPGLEATWRSFLSALDAAAPDAALILKEHPKSGPGSREKSLRAARAGGRKVLDAAGDPDTERWLLACDLIATPFSACAVDHAFLSAFSSEPIGSALFVLTDPGTRRFFREYSGMRRFPTVDAGVGTVAETPAQLREAVAQALRPEAAAAYHRASRTLRMEDPGPKILSIIRSRLGKPRGAGS